MENWLKENKLRWKYIDQFERIIIEIEDVGKFCLIETEPLFDDQFRLMAEEDVETDYWLFQFGSQYYYTKVGTEKKPELNLFKYVGKCKQQLEEDFPYLGVHGGYEILNGSRLYKDWIKKAKFYGYTILGICERNTLGGTLPFQLDCKKNGIKYIIGEEITVKRGNIRFDLKVYVVNEEGWNNLLTIHKAIKIDNEEFVEEEMLLEHGKGLILVMNPDCLLSPDIVEKYKPCFHSVYYQIDTVEWNDPERDLAYLKTLTGYFDYYIEDIPPVLINDSYYLDKSDSHIKSTLNTMAGKNFQYSSDDQYFKNLDDNYLSFSKLFVDKEFFNGLIFECLDNLNKIKEDCVFEINTKELHLPKFDIKDNVKFFKGLIDKGVKEKIIPMFGEVPKEYQDRIDMEFEVIKKHNLIDYFLILWDVISWCKKNDILVGFGRGSAAGAILTYLLDITKVDPIEYNLLFQRFINEGRLLGSLPDLDLDFPQGRREDVKNYIKSKYGENQFCSVGTYTTFQIKSGIQDLGRISGITPFERNYITTRIKIGEGEDGDWKKVFDNAIENPNIKNFVIKNTGIIEDIQLVLAQPKNVSIHASATIVVPKEKDIFHWMPLRKEGDVLISEWEGEYLEKAGFLKEDLLGLQQLDKFKFMVDLIKKHHNKDIDIYNLPLDDKKIYDMFKKGYNSDTFQFGTLGFIDYSKMLQPDNIHDLIAMVALFRPGVMGTGAHIDYVNLKHGRKEVEYDLLCEDITKETYGIMIYQEQLMRICQQVAGYDLLMADEIRRGVGKKLIDVIDSNKPKFIQGAIKNGYTEDSAKRLWHKLEYAGMYMFNLSHATTYAITGYISMWFKANYPLEFWTAALEFVKNMEFVSRFINEMNKLQNVSIMPPDINYSDRNFVADPKTNKIYWSLIQIKEVGEVATNTILEVRKEKGKFFSLEEFIERVPKNKVNKKVIESLIYAGGFDEVERIKSPLQRKKLFEKYYQISNVKIKDDEKNILLSGDVYKEYWWVLKQKEFSGLGYLDYYLLIQDYTDFDVSMFVDGVEFFSEIKGIVSDKMIAGIIVNIIERSSKNGDFAELELDSNDEKIYCVLWNDAWEEYKQYIKIGKIVIVTGKIVYDGRYKNSNVFQSDDNTQVKIIG